MNGIIRFSLNNKFALWIMTFIVVAAGLYAGLTMKQETIPDINVPVIAVTTVYPGAAPDEVAERVTRPIEQRLKNLNGVDAIMSTSAENYSLVVIQYEYEKNMKEALEEAREAVDGVSLPEGAQEPALSRITINAMPVLVVSVSSDAMPLEQLTALVEEELRPSIEGLDGVQEVHISGHYVREAVLTWKEDKLTELGLSKETVQGIIRGSVLKAPLGLFEMEGTQKNIVVDGGVRTLEELRNLAIPVIPSGGGAGAGMGGPGMGGAAGMGNGMDGAFGMGGGAGDAAGMGGAFGPGASAGPDAVDLDGAAFGMDPAAGPDAAADAAGAGAGIPDAAGGDGLLAALMNGGLPTVPLSEIADIELVGRAESISRTNGKEAIAVQIVKAPDANTVEVVNQVKAELSAFKERHEGLDFITMLDMGEPVEQSVATMLDKALFGAIFAVIIILMFLRNVRSTLIAVISIPMSLLIGILLLKLNDITLNMMTLGAMTVAIGRVVDDSIVVIENIYRRMSLKGEQLKGKALILAATKEMFIPIMSSTIVTIAVFLPLGLVSGFVGELFLPFALTMVYSLLASLLVAITIVPMLAHTMFRKGLPESRQTEGPGALAKAYQRGLRWALSRKAVTFSVAVLLLIASAWLFRFVGTSFLPEEDQKYAILSYSAAPGELQEEVYDLALKAESYLMNRADVTDVSFGIGSRAGVGGMAGFGSDRDALFYVMFDDETENFAEVKEQVLADIQAAAPGEGEWGLFDMSAMFGAGGFSMYVFADSYEEIREAAEKIKAVMEEDPNFKDIETGLEETYDQYTLRADQAKLGRYGLTTANIMLALAPARERTVLTTIEADGEVYSVYEQSETASYGTIDDMTGVTLASPLGFEVPIRDVVTVESGESPNTIRLLDGRIYTEITAEVTVKDVGRATADLKKKMDELELPRSVDVEFGGVVEQMNETFYQLGLAMAAAIAIVYLVLVITFGGGLAPFAILFSLPFTAIGAFLALWLTGETLNVSAMMGLLMLIGIVVTNAIVLIDRVIHKERDGLPTREALIEAAGTRLRPILMTAFATVGALLPMLFSIKGAGIISRGMAVTVIGGLTSSTLLTLFIVPAVYEVLMRLRRRSSEERI
ncbi:MAG: Swarming motility protein SwrC [Thermobacillus sp. ZCTH02-B1]|uniref:efflux RND transporter permease subunit n=1 Tax=Thermobacillus sp. ZCTH02-B1 TaxID=1858795 RepID=UPI000B575FBD|nr:efflux RND transporter permease subunit [Thermobacillus sp. ZCTH02-B1]OUM94382.1 MAG: Swarming motility protein SwrC [Thermobacillus sp. ZCTH02-B1]